MNQITTEDGKNPAAVALGRLGGLKGGKARAAKMTPTERSQSARRAAEKRWGLVPSIRRRSSIKEQVTKELHRLETEILQARKDLKLIEKLERELNLRL